MNATDLHAVVWSRAGSGNPRKLGSLVITPEEARFTYSAEAVELARSGAPRADVSLLYPAAAIGTAVIVHPRSEALPLHPAFMALIPPDQPNNLQRRALAQYLAESSVTPPTPGFATDWAMLMLAGHGGIGHLDVFADDRAAAAYYGQQPHTIVATATRAYGSLLAATLGARLVEPVTDAVELLRPRATVGGMIPKVLVSMPAKGWDGRVGQPGMRDHQGEPFTDAILKFEARDYAGMVELERLALEAHGKAGLPVPRFWSTVVAGRAALAVERFDRTPEGRPIPVESAFSLLAIAKQGIASPTSGCLEDVGQLIRLADPRTSASPGHDSRTLFLRVCLALTTGNGDMHLENLSFLGQDNPSLSPVYDPTPMRAWDQHDMVTCLPFGTFLPRGGELPADPYGALLGFARSLSLPRKSAVAVIERAIECGRHFQEGLCDLESVPPHTMERLSRVVGSVSGALAASASRPTTAPTPAFVPPG